MFSKPIHWQLYKRENSRSACHYFCVWSTHKFHQPTKISPVGKTLFLIRWAFVRLARNYIPCLGRRGQNHTLSCNTSNTSLYRPKKGVHPMEQKKSDSFSVHRTYYSQSVWCTFHFNMYVLRTRAGSGQFQAERNKIKKRINLNAISFVSYPSASDPSMNCL